MKRIVFYIISLLVISNSIYSQDFIRSSSITSSSGTNEGSSISYFDNQLFIISDFSGTISLDQDYTSDGKDIFITKYTSEISRTWFHKIGGGGFDFGNDIVYYDGYIYILGGFQQDINFEKTTLNSDGFLDIFLAKYDLSGQEIWAKKIAYNSDKQFAAGLDVDKNGDLVIAGFYRGSVTTELGTSSNAYGLYILKSDTAGDLIWSKDIQTDDLWSKILDVKAFDDGYYFTGSLRGNGYFDTGTETSTSTTYNDGFIYKIAYDGTGRWLVKTTSDADVLMGTSIDDAYGNLYVTGSFSDGDIQVELEDDGLLSEAMTSNGGNDIFIYKFNKTGQFAWGNNYGGEGKDWARGILYQNEFLYLTGFFSDTTVFGQDSLFTSGSDDADVFLGLLDKGGNELRAVSIDGSDDNNDSGYGLVSDSENNAYLSGYYRATEIYPGSETLQNPYSPSAAFFLAKYDPPFSATFSKKQDVTCNGGSDGELIVNHYFGVPPFTYDWSHDAGLNDSIATGLMAGDYQVIISDDAGSKDTLNYTVTQPDPFVFDPAITHVTTCSYSTEGAITLNMSGGNGDNDYIWDASEGGYGVVLTDENQTGLTPGRYDVTVTDIEGCMADTTIYVTGPPAMSFENSVVTNYTAPLEKGAIDLEVSGGTGTPGTYDASWTGPSGYTNNVQDISNLDAGDYTVAVTDDNGCTADTTFNVLDEQALYAYISESKDACQVPADNGSATVEYYTPLSDPDISYQWDANAGNQTTATATGLAPNTYSVTVTDNNNSQTSVATVTINQLAYTIDGNLSGTAQLDCYGDTDGYVDLNITTEGTQPYTYLWSNAKTTQDISGLGIGSYNVTVTDANECTFTPAAAYEITEPEQLVADIAIRDEISCFGEFNGALEVTGTSGGNGGYNYLWNDPGSQTTTVADGLDDGFYHVSVTDSKGCQYVTNDIHLIEPDEIVIAETAFDISCNGLNDGAILLDVSGGTTPFDYFWTTEDGSGLSPTTKNQSDLGPGTYNVIATDANLCETTLDVVINEPAAITIDSESKTDVEGCFGDATGEIEVAASGGTGSLIYTLTPGDVENASGTFGSLSADSYTVAIRDDNSCEVTTALEITQPTEVTIAETSATDESAAGAGDGSVSATAEGGTSPYTYTLSPGGTENQTGLFENLDAGTYTISITDANGCGSLVTSDLVVGSRTGFDDINGGKLYVFPNPATSNLTIQWESELAGSFMIELISLTGEVHAYKKVEKTGNEKQTSFALNDLARGIYLLRVTDENGQSHQKKIVLK